MNVGDNNQASERRRAAKDRKKEKTFVKKIIAVRRSLTRNSIFIKCSRISRSHPSLKAVVEAEYNEMRKRDDRCTFTMFHILW